MISIKWGTWHAHPSVPGGYESTWYYLHDPSTGNPTTLAPGGQLTRSVDDIDALTFKLYSNNVAYHQLIPIKTHVKAIEESTGEMLFYGRVIGVEPTMDSDGQIYEQVTCEQAEAFLLDSTIDTTKFINPEDLDSSGCVMMQAVDFLNEVFNQHNEQVIGYENMDLGDLGFLADPDVKARVPYTYGTVAHDLIKDVIIDDLSNTDPNDVWFWSNYNRRLTFNVTEDSGSAYLIDITLNIVDYDNTETVGTIELGVNMGAVSQEPDYTDIVTVVNPWGDEYHDANGFPYRMKLIDYLRSYGGEPDPAWTEYFTFDTDNNTISYDPGVDEYGSIVRPLQQSGLSQNGVDAEGKKTEEIIITRDQAAQFLWGAMQYLIKHSRPKVSLSVTAYDLSLIGRDFARFDLYQRWNISHSLLGLQENLPVIRHNIDIDNPHLSSLEFGMKGARESDQKNAQSTALAKVAQNTGNGDVVEATRLGQSNRVGIDTKGGDTYVTMDTTQHYALGSYFSMEYPKDSGGYTSTYDFHTSVSGVPFNMDEVLNPDTSSQMPMIPARTTCNVGFTMYYAAAVFWHSYCNKNGVPMEGLLSNPKNFRTQIYKHINDIAAQTPSPWYAETLKWADIEDLYNIGVIAFMPGRHNAVGMSGTLTGPLYWHPKYLVTGAMADNGQLPGGVYPTSNVSGSSTPFNLSVAAGGSINFAFEKISRRVIHPEFGVVQPYWVLVRANFTVTNYTTVDARLEPHGGVQGVGFVFWLNGHDLDNPQPDYAVNDGSSNAGKFVLHMADSFHTDQHPDHSGYVSPYSMRYWGHSISIGEVTPRSVTNVCYPTWDAEYGVNVDTGAPADIANQWIDLRTEWAPSS